MRDNGSKYDVDDIAYWDENVTVSVDMEPDYLRHDKFYDLEQDLIRAPSAFRKNRKLKLISTLEVILLKIRVHVQYGY